MIQYVCLDCRAKGSYDINYTCTECGSSTLFVMNDCPECNGLGVIGWQYNLIEGDICPVCEGEGVVE